MVADIRSLHRRPPSSIRSTSRLSLPLSGPSAATPSGAFPAGHRQLLAAAPRADRDIHPWQGQSSSRLDSPRPEGPQERLDFPLPEQWGFETAKLSTTNTRVFSWPIRSCQARSAEEIFSAKCPQKQGMIPRRATLSRVQRRTDSLHQSLDARDRARAARIEAGLATPAKNRIPLDRRSQTIDSASRSCWPDPLCPFRAIS